MYLKSIEIQGFKSFANKTVLQFNRGITGIVGPNGSGKSNVADAVRWVLGEQKVKQLRGSSMQDVIFAGTELRKPQAFAFVAITLDNSDHILPVDYTEVTVSRRLYRSGESEYMINGQQVRLRDVQELFYDTGIGKEGYSIIGQGQVESILNGRPEDRRGLFDEACGIVKFKRRKTVAERKLESERANLIRIKDILSELSQRVEPLRKQSEAAREYLGLRDRLKLLDLNLFLRECRSAQEELQKADGDIDLVKASLSDAREEDEELRSGSEALSVELLSIEKELDEKRAEISEGRLRMDDIRNELGSIRSDMELRRANIAHYEERMERLLCDIEERERSASAQLLSLSELRSELSMIDGSDDDGSARALRDLLDEITAMKAELADALGMDEEELEARLSELSEGGKASAGQGKASAGDQSHKDGDDAGTSEDAPGDTSGREGDKADDADDEDDEDDDDEFFREPEWLKAIKSKRSSLDSIEEKGNRVAAWLAGAEEEYNKRTLDIKELNRAINDCQQDYHMTATKLDSLKNLAERYEGYGQSIKSVMQRRSSWPGIKGVVADLLHTEAGYETAVETALGGNIQNIVTDTEYTARDIIEYLKKNKLGRATFLPLDAIKQRDPGEYEKALSEDGVIGLASDIVSCDEEYEELRGYLLGRTLVAENIDSALRMARKYGHRLRIVTLAGELLMPGGSISGGAYKNSSNLLGRQREIEELKKEAKRVLEKIDGLNEKLVEAEKKAEEASSEIDSLRAELSEVYIEKNRLSLEIISEFRMKLAGLSQKAGFVSENMKRIISEIRRASEEREGLRQCLGSDAAAIREKEEEASGLSDLMSSCAEDTEKAEKRVAELSEKKSGLSASQQEYFRRKDEISASILSLEKELMRLESAREKKQQRLDEKTEYIWGEYELTQSSAAAYEDESLGSSEELQKECNYLRKHIRELGPVNVSAIEEYKEVAERYEFLTAQHEDLVASEASILAVIDELDKGMKKQFAERFELIRTEFDKVFKELFGGGSGKLELSEPEDGDELSAGIIINAQPPGKKLQNMMQLSGGEKALTAIALLFAIQNLKPSPFCLLDEIEAALDDSNIDRFAGYLGKLTDSTQFIVITHRRGTMEFCDRLYGITMQEKGITALVSVDLISDSLS